MNKRIKAVVLFVVTTAKLYGEDIAEQKKMIFASGAVIGIIIILDNILLRL